LLASAAAALESCSHQQCVDQNNVVVDPGFCEGTLHPMGGYGYRWYTGGGNYAVGSTVPATSTVRGVFGGAGDAAHSGGSGGGEGAGE
jgi:hypothetical protein